MIRFYNIEYIKISKMINIIYSLIQSIQLNTQFYMIYK